MTPEEVGAELARLFSGPHPPPGKDRWHHPQYIPVRRPDGMIEFVRDPLDVQLQQIFTEYTEELFGPEPAEDLSNGNSTP
jgi:hypothetical protein